MKVRECVLLQI